MTITVNPKPLLVFPAAQSVCNGSNSLAIVFNSIPAGSTYTWINNNASIGLSASGNGTIPSFIAVNSGNTLTSATLTVTPTLSGCVGLAQNLAIDVQPTPTAPTVSNAIVCVYTSATLTATAPGGNYEWFNVPSGGSPL